MQVLFYSLLFLAMSGMSQVMSHPGRDKRCLGALFPTASVVSLRVEILGYAQIPLCPGAADLVASLEGEPETP